MNDHTLRQLADEHRHERIVEAQHGRLGAQCRDRRYRRARLRPNAAMLGHILAIRRHATP